MSARLPIPLNAGIAARFDEVAHILAEQNANPYRISAYQAAARTIRNWPESISQLIKEHGVAGLMRLPAIGERLARSTYQLATTGYLPMLERLRGESDPVELIGSVPTVGPKTARQIHERLGIDTLEELESAAHDGRLEGLGVGPKRLAGIRDALAGRLGRVGRRSIEESVSLPPVAEILDVDRQYREASSKGALPRIAPRRFNPRHEAWLSILHTRRGPREYTALYSNTARAHELGRTRDWVVLYFDGESSRERQCTVITAERGPLHGQRIVRGREAECLAYHSHPSTQSSASLPH
jgi:DNA polymerase (family 10)